MLSVILCRKSGSRDSRFQHPARIVRQHSDVRIVRSSLWCGEQDKPSRETGGRMSSDNQLTANPQLLKFDSNRQIRKIRAKTEIRNRATHADQQFTRPSRHDHVGIPQHQLNAFTIIHRTSFRQRRSLQHIDELIHRQCWFHLIVNGHGNLIPCCRSVGPVAAMPRWPTMIGFC